MRGADAARATQEALHVVEQRTRVRLAAAFARVLVDLEVLNARTWSGIGSGFGLG